MTGVAVMLRLLLAAVLLLCFDATAAVGQGSNAEEPGPRLSAADGVAAALTDTLGARLAELEVRRVELTLSGRASTHADVVHTERTLTALQALIAELPDPAAARKVIHRQILEAIDARLAGLIVERRVLAAAGELSPGHYRLRQLATAQEAFERRSAELRQANTPAPPRPR